jgi:hypothetical protein
VDHHHLVLLLSRLAEASDTLAMDPAANKDTTQHNNNKDSRITVVFNGRVFHPEAEDLPKISEVRLPSSSNVLNLVVDTMNHQDPSKDLKVKEDMEVQRALLPHQARHH